MNNITNTSPLAAIVSTYDPEETISDNLHTIAAQVEQVYLINDSGSTEIREYLEKKVSHIANVKLLHNTSNLGLAKSLNIAVRIAEDSGFEWVMIFDDDTKTKPDSIDRLQALISSTEASNNIYSLARVNSRNISSSKLHLVKRKVTITSGTLFSTGLFNILGGFDESFHIDFLDFDFCFRTHSAGGQVLQTNSGEIMHRVGTPLFRRLFFFRVMTHNHRPARYYYHYRSAVLLTKRHCVSQPAYIVRLWSGLFWKLFKMLMIEPERSEKARYSVLGVVHGVLNHVEHSPKV